MSLDVLSIASVSYQEALNADADLYTAGAWRTIDINAEEFDPDGIVSVGSSRFTLGAGTYLVRAVSLEYGGGTGVLRQYRLRFYDVTGAAGVTPQGLNTAAESSMPYCLLTGLLIPTVTTAYELQIQLDADGSGARDQGSLFPGLVDIERYAQIDIRQIA